MSTFLLSYFPHLYGRKFGNEFLVVPAHGTLNGLVILQTLQRLLPCPIVRIAEYLRKLFCCKFVWQQTETLLELIRATALLGSITQLIVIVKAMQFVISTLVPNMRDLTLLPARPLIISILPPYCKLFGCKFTKYFLKNQNLLPDNSIALGRRVFPTDLI